MLSKNTGVQLEISHSGDEEVEFKQLYAHFKDQFTGRFISI